MLRVNTYPFFPTGAHRGDLSVWRGLEKAKNVNCFTPQALKGCKFVVVPWAERLGLRGQPTPLSLLMLAWLWIQKARGLAPSGFELCVSQTPLGVEINMATIWLLLHVGRAEEGGRINAQTIVRPRRSPKHPRVHASPTLPWCNHMFHCSRRKSMSELMCARLLVGSRRSQKSRFHVQHHAFLLAFPSDDGGGWRDKKNKVEAPHLGRREGGKVEIPKWKINSNHSGRSDEREFHSRKFRALLLLLLLWELG